MTYMWNFFDEPYIDGLITVAATLKSKREASIRINDIPYVLIENIEETINKIGCQTEIVECPNALTKSTDLRMKVFATEPIFDALPRYSERRFDIPNAPIEFIHGYLTGGCRVKFQDMYRIPSLKGHDWITIHNPLPKYDKIDLLKRVGIDAAKELFGILYIKDQNFRNKEPFETIYSLQKSEYELAKANNPTKAQQLEILSKEIMGTKGEGFFNPEEPETGGGTY